MSTLAWQQPLWGSVLQQPIGGSAPPDVGSSFVFFTSLDTPNTSGASYETVPGIGQQGGYNGFVAPFDLTLKTISDRVTRVGGYRQDTKYAIRINGGSIVDLVTVTATTEGARVTEVNHAISAGDEVELLYNCGNNYNMGVGLGFYFEATDPADRASGSVMVLCYDPSFGASVGSGTFGDFSSYNVFPVAPVSFVIRRVSVGVQTAMITTGTFYLLDFDDEQYALDDLAIGETSVTTDGINIPVLRGQRMIGVYGQAGGAEAGWMATMECQIAAFEDKPNQSIIMFSDSDADAAQSWHTGYFVPPTSGAIKSLWIGSPFSYGSFVVNVEINGVDTEVWNGAITGDVLAEALPNLSYVAGDEIRVHHDGNGLTGGDTDITLLIESPYGDAYESPVYVPPVDPVPAGDESEYRKNNYTASTSSNGAKGNVYKMKGDRMITQVSADSNTASQTYKFWILELDDDYLVTAILHEGTEFLTVGSQQDYILDTPIAIADGQLFAVVTTRTDVAQVRMDYDRSPIEIDPDGNMIIMGTITQVSDTFAVTDDVYYESQSVWDIWITTEASSLEGTHRYWSILCEGSDDGAAHSIAELELRASPGGANLITDQSELLASSADALADIANLIDADNATVWEITDADFDVGDRRIVYAGSPATVQEIVITSDSGANYDKTPTDFKLQFSEDGFAWNDAYTVSGEAAWSAGETRTYTRPQTDESKENHQYWAVFCQSNANGQSYAAIVNLEMHETIAGPDITDSADYIEGDHFSAQDGSNAFDGAAGTYWQVQHSATRQNQRWVGQDFGVGNETVIEEISIECRSGSQDLQSPLTGAVMWSDDGVDWRIAWLFEDTTTWVASTTRTFSRP